MLGISFPELLIIACVIFVVIKPADLPVISKYYKIIRKKMLFVRAEAGKMLSAFHNMFNEEDESRSKMIRGDDGKFYEAFDIEELTSDEKAKRKSTKKSKTG